MLSAHATPMLQAPTSSQRVRVTGRLSPWIKELPNPLIQLGDVQRLVQDLIGLRAAGPGLLRLA